MRSFGVDERLIKLWYNAHELTIVNDFKTGIKSRLMYQRKSGVQ